MTTSEDPQYLPQTHQDVRVSDECVELHREMGSEGKNSTLWILCMTNKSNISAYFMNNIRICNDSSMTQHNIAWKISRPLQQPKTEKLPKNFKHIPQMCRNTKKCDWTFPKIPNGLKVYWKNDCVPFDRRIAANFVLYIVCHHDKLSFTGYNKRVDLHRRSGSPHFLMLHKII